VRLHVLHPKGEPPDLSEPRLSLAPTALACRMAWTALGRDVFLGLDDHHRLGPGVLDLLEEPPRAQSPDAYRMLRTMTEVPFAIGEEFTSAWDFTPWLDGVLMQFARIAVSDCGGLTNA
jgi:galactonate dehydratase